MDLNDLLNSNSTFNYFHPSPYALNPTTLDHFTNSKSNETVRGLKTSRLDRGYWDSKKIALTHNDLSSMPIKKLLLSHTTSNSRNLTTYLENHNKKI
jgi:hypothetical protein